MRDQDIERVRRALLQLSAAQITAPPIYDKRYPEEIWREVDANARLTAEALEQRDPGLARVVTAG